MIGIYQPEYAPPPRVLFTRTDPSDSRAKLPRRATADSYGYDVFAKRDMWLEPGELQVFGIGWKLAWPLPAAIFVTPRSSLRKRHGCIIPNSPGLVDKLYGDELGVQLENVSRRPMHIVQGEAFAQFVFVPVLLPDVDETMRQDERMTRKGFGSTDAASQSPAGSGS